MRHKTLLINDSYGEQLENTVFYVGHVEIGNNFTLDHTFQFMNDDQIDCIDSISRFLELSGNCRIIAQGSYSNIKIDISAYDLCDFIRYECNKRF